MSTPYQYALRRRSPFSPYDPNDPQGGVQDQGSMYAPTPDVSVGGGTPPQQTPPSLFRPADKSAAMGDITTRPDEPPPYPTTSMYAPADKSAAMQGIESQPGDVAAPTERGIRSTRPERPAWIPAPKRGAFTPTHANDEAAKDTQLQNASNLRVYEADLREWQNEQDARRYGMTAPGESQLIAVIRENPGSPQAAWAQGELDKMRKYNAPQGKESMPALDPLYADTLAHPDKYTPEQVASIKAAHEADRRFNQPPRPEPMPSFSQMQVDLRDGRKNVPVNYNSKTGKYSLPTGEDVTALVSGVSRVAPGQNPAVEAAIEEAAQSAAKYDLTALKDMTVFRGDNRTLVFGRARQINPQFNSSELDRRIKMMDDVTNGKTGLNIQSLGTFLEHAGELSDVIRGISQSNVPALNQPLNWWRRNMAGSADLQRLETAIEPVGKEFEAFLLNNRALYEQDRKDIQRLLDPAMSPAQILATLTQMGRTVNARYNEMNTRFKRTVGGKNIHDVFPELFPPEAVDAARKIGITPPAGGGGGATGATYKYTATGQNGQKVGSNDGKTWTPIK